MIRPIRITALFLLFAVSLCPLFADDDMPAISIIEEDDEIPLTVDLTEENISEQISDIGEADDTTTFTVSILGPEDDIIAQDSTLVDGVINTEAEAVLVSMEVILQDKARGGFVVLDPEDLTLLGGHLSSLTEPAYFTAIPSNAMTAHLIVPAIIAQQYLAIANERDGIELLKPYVTENEAVVLVSSIYLEGPITLTDLDYHVAKVQLDARVNASGLNPSDIYKAYEEKEGLTEEDVVNMYMADPTSVQNIVEHGIRLVRPIEEDMTWKYFAVAAGAITAFALIGAIIMILKAKMISVKRDKKETE